MRRLHIIPALLLTMPLLAGACAESVDSTPGALGGTADNEAIASATADAQRLTATGSLTDVDPEERTLTIDMPSANGTEAVEFRYDAATQVLGADGQVQALTGQDGSRVTVTYWQEGNTRHAVRIQMSPSLAATDPVVPSAATPTAPDERPAAP
jgi:hypothetical protein